MTARQIDRVWSHNSVSERHSNANETVRISPEQDPRTNRTGQYASQHSGVTTRRDIAESGWVLEEFGNSSWPLQASSTDQLNQAKCSSVELAFTHVDAELLMRRAV